MTAYYNEHDKFAAAWLRELIKAGQIAPGFVDERSIEDVTPDELNSYTQCHFFAGIGTWSYALRAAGWPDDRRVWTGSCPCQPFSAAGKGEGFDDERHLWPAFFWLIRQCRPGVVFGEQVAAKAALSWFDLVATDLEAAGYTIASSDLCAAGVGAPHIRQRLWWVAHAVDAGSQGRLLGREDARRQDQHRHAGRGGAVGGLADSEGERRGEAGAGIGQSAQRAGDGCELGGLADACDGSRQRSEPRATVGRLPAQIGRDIPDADAGPTNGFWRTADWLACRDGKWRAVEPGTFPLAHGATARVGSLRGYGNGIVATLAQEFVEAYEDVRTCRDLV